MIYFPFIILTMSLPKFLQLLIQALQIIFTFLIFFGQ